MKQKYKLRLIGLPVAQGQSRMYPLREQALKSTGAQNAPDKGHQR